MNVLITVKGNEPDGYFRHLTTLLALERAGTILLAHVIDTRPRDTLEVGRRRLLDRRPLPEERTRDVTGVEEERAARVLQDALARLESAGVPVERVRTVSLRGKPNERLREVAEREGAILVVGGREGQGPHSVGKTARFLIDHAPIGAVLLR